MHGSEGREGEGEGRGAAASIQMLTLVAQRLHFDLFLTVSFAAAVSRFWLLLRESDGLRGAVVPLVALGVCMPVGSISTLPMSRWD